VKAIIPYLNFDNNCEEAMTFYQKCLGGHLFIQKVKETPMKDQMPPGNDDSVIHSYLELEKGVEIAGSDMMGQPFNRGNASGVTLNTDDETLAKEWFTNLSEGGQVTMDLQSTFWAKQFGMLNDKYGVSWMINVANEETAR
jgi:PhnB protein